MQEFDLQSTARACMFADVCVLRGAAPFLAKMMSGEMLFTLTARCNKILQ
jgi:hypothetical protein